MIGAALLLALQAAPMALPADLVTVEGTEGYGLAWSPSSVAPDADRRKFVAAMWLPDNKAQILRSDAVADCTAGRFDFGPVSLFVDGVFKGTGDKPMPRATADQFTYSRGGQDLLKRLCGR